MRYALINSQNIVENVIELNGAEWPVPEGFRIIASEALNIGDISE